MIKKHDNNILSLEYQNGGGYLFKLQEKDRWSYIDHYYIKEEMISTFPLNELLSHKTNTLEATDKVYFTKSSSIPRYKLKEFLELTKIELNRTNKIDYANTYIASINAFKEFIYSTSDRYNRYYVVPADDMIPYAARGYKKQMNEKNLTTVLVRESDVKNNAPGVNFSKYPLINIIPVDNGWGSSKLKNIAESFVYLAGKKNDVKIIFDETLIEICNSGVVIDEEIYENLSSMLSSKNKENVSLAMEIISNSDFVHSRIYILMLLNKYSMEFKIVDKTTNFKSLLNYFSSYYELINKTWETFTDTMLREHCPTDEEKLIMKKYMLSRLNEHMKNYGCKLKIKDIVYE